MQWNEHSGDLRISGFGLITHKDLMMSRLSGTPTFGRFEIDDRFPRNLLNMEEATLRTSKDGTLQIRIEADAALLLDCGRGSERQARLRFFAGILAVCVEDVKLSFAAKDAMETNVSALSGDVVTVIGKIGSGT